ncbi:hypothetical protein GA512_01975 [Bacillus paralicheniformis]|nr:hypothetical protein [Bacillus paralicheniformis]
MVDIDDRMPVIITDGNEKGRLNLKTEYLQSLLQPYDADDMEAYRLIYHLRVAIMF